jgi:membrane associated rhomboid family serine protease
MLRREDRPQREPILNTPGLVGWMIGILSGIFLLQMLAPDTNFLVETSFGVIPARYFGDGTVPPSLLPDAWARLVPLVSYSVLHGSPAHLLINVAWLLAIGTPVAQRLGNGRFLLFYIVATIAAALFYIFVKADSAVPMIGASGAISGLFGGLTRFMFHRRPDVPSLNVTDRRVLFFAVTWLGLNMIIGLIGLGGSADSSIAWEAHAGGFLAGLVLFPYFERRPATIG